MKDLQDRNQKIINAVIRKAEQVCPGALALIGIYGSFMTGDYFDKSDLDLLIVINDERGYQLAACFIQEDLQVGHDIYCVSWEQLEEDAEYHDPNISRLMDAKIVYCADQQYQTRLDLLREKARDILAAPYSPEDHEKAEAQLKEAEVHFAEAMISDSVSEVLSHAGGVIYFIENAVAMLNKQYFRLGVKRVYEELDTFKIKPENFCGLIENILTATSMEEVKEQLKKLLKETKTVFGQVKEDLPAGKRPASRETLEGTYEEMYSNWRNKMHLAAETGNRHLAFMSLTSAHAMFLEIQDNVDIKAFDALKCYDPEDLEGTAAAYDGLLKEYLQEYVRGHVPERKYADIDAFTEAYLTQL